MLELWAVRLTVSPHDAAGKKGTAREQLILFLGLAKPLLFAIYADFADRANH
jgi:hypothetical protein